MSDAEALAAARDAYAAGDFTRALALARDALAQQDADETLILYVNAATRAGSTADAVAGLERLHARHPTHAQFARMLSAALNNLGTRAQDAAAACASYDRALALWPDNVEALYNRALAARRDGDDASAVALLSRAAALAPRDDALALELAAAEIALDATRNTAVESLRAVASRADAELAPRVALAAANAGLDEIALAALARTDSITAALSAAAVLADHGAIDAARQAYARAAALGGRGIRAPSLRGVIGERLALSPVHEDAAAIARARTRYAGALAELDAELDVAHLARCESALEQIQWTNFLLAYHGEDDRALQSRYGDVAARAAAVFAPQHAERPARTGRRRIAVVSSFLRESTVGAYFAHWIDVLVAAGYVVDAFALGSLHDATTERIAAAASSLTRLDGPLERDAAAIRAARPELVLYPELGMDARTFALATLRLAPVQCCAWGHPVTTGLPTIDAYFTCATMEPRDAAAHYRERSLALPGLGTRYRAPPAPPRYERAALGLPDRGRLYLVPQSAFKIHPDNDAVIAAVARNDRVARIVLFENERRGATRALRTRLERALIERGADPAQLLFLPMTSRARYLAINAACDVMIDTLHWSGGNTTLDALRAGLPVVTCAGRHMRGRQSAAMLALAGLADALVVAAPSALAARAVAVAADRDAELARRIDAAWPALVDSDAADAALVAHCDALIARTPA